jgi:hypothetical protein
VVQWLRNCAPNRMVAGSIPDGVIEFFYSLNLSAAYDPSVDSASNRKADNLATFMCRLF